MNHTQTEQRLWFWIDSLTRIARSLGTSMPYPYGFAEPVAVKSVDGITHSPIPPVFYASPMGDKLTTFIHEQVLGANPEYRKHCEMPYPATKSEWSFEDHGVFRNRGTLARVEAWKRGRVVSGEDLRRFSRVILMGCGVDSTLAVFYASKALRINLEKSTLLLYVDYKGPYSDKETQVARTLLRDLSARFRAHIAYVELDIHSITHQQLVKGYILPLRNAVLSAVAASFIRTKGGEVWLGANYRKVDDDPGAAVDKSRKFFGTMTELLSAQWDRPVRVMSPFLHLSKAETVRWAVEAIGHTETVALLDMTTTCYHATEQRCGACYACFKLALMLKLTALNLPSFDVSKAERNPEFRTYLEREKAKGRVLPTEWLGDNQ